MLDPTTKDLKTMREEKHECLSMASKACEPHVLVVNPWPKQELVSPVLSLQTMAWRWRNTRTPIAARTCNLKPLNPAPDWTWVTQLSCFLVSGIPFRWTSFFEPDTNFITISIPRERSCIFPIGKARPKRPMTWHADQTLSVAHWRGCEACSCSGA